MDTEERIENIIERMRKRRKEINKVEEILEMQVEKTGIFDELDNLNAEIKRLEEELHLLIYLDEKSLWPTDLDETKEATGG